MLSSRPLRWAAPAAVVGGLLWALFPVGAVFVAIDGEQSGSLGLLAAATFYWLLAVAPLLLLLAALAALHVLSRASYGRLGRVGFFVSFAALSLMFAGNALEVGSLTVRGSESAAGHSVFLLGFLILLIGSAILGLALVRARRDPTSRAGGWLLVGALPIGILLAVVLGALAPATDLGFWAAITVPYGVAWVLLGRSMSYRHAEPAGQPARVA
jgi:hypothetical protein